MNIDDIEIEEHPFEAFIPKNATILIVGSFPGKEQTNKNTDPDQWFYGAKRNQFWKILSSAYNIELITKEDKQNLFRKNGIGITDILLKIQRKNNSNLDNNLVIKEANDRILKKILEENNFTRILFTSKYVEILFLKYFPDTKNYSCLLSPSGGANIPISKSKDYLQYKKENPTKNTIDFRIHEYKRQFNISSQ